MGAQFSPASRAEAKLSVLLWGPTESGKTLSALRLGARLAEREAAFQGRRDRGRVAVADSEGGRARLHLGSPLLPTGFVFDTLIIEAPHAHAKYVEAARQAKKDGYDVFILDTATHAWKASGGLLEQHHAEMVKLGGMKHNDRAWAKITPLVNALVHELAHNGMHTIITCRARWEAKQKFYFVDFRPDTLEYEAAVVFELEKGSHSALPRKDNTGLFRGNDNRVRVKDKINPVYADMMFDWLHANLPPRPGDPPNQAWQPTGAQQPGSTPQPGAPLPLNNNPSQLPVPGPPAISNQPPPTPPPTGLDLGGLQ